MDCPCGSLINTSFHDVTTQLFVDKWTDIKVSPPINVRQDKCPKCGREKVTIKDESGTIIDKRG